MQCQHYRIIIKSQSLSWTIASCDECRIVLLFDVFSVSYSVVFTGSDRGRCDRDSGGVAGVTSLSSLKTPPTETAAGKYYVEI